MKQDDELARFACVLIENTMPHLPPGVQMTVILSKPEGAETDMAMVSNIEMADLSELLKQCAEEATEENKITKYMGPKEKGN